MSGPQRAPAPSGSDRVGLAIAVILSAALALSLGDALIKLSSAGLGLWQIFVLRSVIALPVLVAAARLHEHGLRWMPHQPGWVALRSALLILMWIAYYAALPHLALSVAAAAYYTLPIFITLFAAVLIGEPVGGRGWIAVALGFAGACMVLKPTGEDFNAFAMLPLVSAMLYALAMILTRAKCRQEHPLILSMGLVAAFVPAGLLGMLLLPAEGAGFLSAA